MLGGMACNVGRHLYVDLQLYVLTIYWTAQMNTDRICTMNKYCMKHVHVRIWQMQN